MGAKSLKKLLRELGFHFSWRVWILNGPNNEKNLRLTFDKGNIYPTKKGYIYDSADQIQYKGVNPEVVKNKLITFFNIPQ